MKDLSFFLFKNSLGAKMRKGYSNFCNGNASTSTLNQRKTAPTGDSHTTLGATTTPASTLEEMLLQLEFEEKMARKEKQDNEYGETRRRKSCVNNSDILRSARNALNQYPRFSLDGKDAMYRSSFRNLPPTGRESLCCNYGVRKGLNKGGFNSETEKFPCLPPVIGGESVVWCKPGVVAKLMGLEAVPIPVNKNCRREKLSTMIKRQNLRKRADKHEMERRKGENKRGMMGSCSSSGYRVMKPIKVEPASDGAGWHMRRFT
ncbi:uncharacterized protein LOC130772460 [Actinidia eriantha]|uniref:uncharacterized protein LOC130772460 n=1 Tax=Actinidia eriantha TaxID=165200 RepID=UPI0025838E0E|nr:uncharacterized protein LOC130772460 [Actinidia eriantha]